MAARLALVLISGQVQQLPAADSLTGSTHADSETPAGTINGTDGTDGNAVFTLAQTPSPAASLQLFKTDIGSGVFMIAGVHYNLSGLTITYTAGNLPITGTTHRAFYRY